jgi:hypothetical protein
LKSGPIEGHKCKRGRIAAGPVVVGFGLGLDQNDRTREVPMVVFERDIFPSVSVKL